MSAVLTASDAAAAAPPLPHPPLEAAAAAGRDYPSGHTTTPPPSMAQQMPAANAGNTRTPRTPSSVSFAEDARTPAAARAGTHTQSSNGPSTPTHASASPNMPASTTPAPAVRAGILKTSTPRAPLLPPYAAHPQSNGVNGHASVLAVPSPKHGSTLALGIALPPTIDVAHSDLHPRPLTPSPSTGSSPVPSRLLPLPMPMSPSAVAYALSAQHFTHSYPAINGTAVVVPSVSAAAAPAVPASPAAPATAGASSAHASSLSPKCSCDAPAFSTPAATHSRPPLAHIPQQPAPVPPLKLPSDSPPSAAAAPLPPQLSMPPMLPSIRLLFRQLQQSSLWDRLFTHCTGRDLLAKIVQHGCGLLRCLLQLWEWAYRRLVQHAAFRRMFLRGADVKTPLPAAQAAKAVLPTVAAASPATGPASHSIAIVSLLPASTGGASEIADSAAVAPSASAATAAAAAVEDDLDVFAPPSDASSLSTRLAHVSYTMYRARQVLRLGRWLYDIPDVRDSALELWYGVSMEEKSAETQEAEEEWEEHERVHVVRSRRASWDASTMRVDGSGGGRGTFTFPLSARTPAMSPASVSPRSGAERQGHRSSMSVGGSAARGRARPLVVRSASADGLEQLRDRDDAGDASIASTDGSSASSSSQQHRPRQHFVAHASATAASFAGPYGDEDDPDTDDADAEEEDGEDDDDPSLLEWSVGVIDFANSLMGLLIDASDDLDFISSVGLLPERVGEVAGQVSSYLWLLSGGVDVAMCCWKLYEYRCEMRETLREKMEEWTANQKQLQMQQQQQQLMQQEPQQQQQQMEVQLHPVCAMHPVPSWGSVGASTPIHLSLPASVATPPPSRLAAGPAAASSVALGSLSLCSSSCDVDCVHIESLRLFRYVGELGLSVCGLVELRGGLRGDGVADVRLEALMEASGLLSGFATFIKRGATHARSKSVVQRAESNANMQMALYS